MNSSNISFSEINNISELVLITESWTELNISCTNCNLFKEPQWIFAWLNTYWQNTWHLKVLTAWQDKELIAIVPLYYQQETFFSLQTLYPLGQGEAEKKEISSEYLDILIQPKHKSETIKYITDWIEKLSCEQLVWKALTENSIANEVLTSLNKNMTKSQSTRYLVAAQSWKISKLSKNMRSRYRRGLNQLTKLDAKIGWVKSEKIDQYWQLMKEFHQLRWRNKDKAGAFASDEFNQFHQKFRQQAPEKIAMSAIWINDSPIAIHYYFRDSSTLYFYQSGWNENEYAQISPGLILHLWGIEHNTEAFYDFMMGKKQGSYKAKFSPLQQPMYNISINFSPIKLIVNRILKKIKLIKH